MTFFFQILILNPPILIDYIVITTPAGEPVLSVLDELVLQNFRPILRTGPDDDVLPSQLLLVTSTGSVWSIKVQL
jgi:hypothetical protein